MVDNIELIEFGEMEDDFFVVEDVEEVLCGLKDMVNDL